MRNSEVPGADDHTLRFVQYLKEVLAKVSNPAPDELVHLETLLKGVRSKEQIDPAEFYEVGNILYQKKNPTMGELSNELSVPLSSATRMANWWVDNGYARRLSDPDDRRVVRLTLTDQGMRLLESLEKHITATVEKVLAVLSEEEQATLVRLFGKVASSLREPAAH
ncbi:MAG: MarR family transcriptional regulator [Dehalococcoidia bacterium]